MRLYKIFLKSGVVLTVKAERLGIKREVISTPFGNVYEKESLEAEGADPSIEYLDSKSIGIITSELLT